MKGYYSGLLLLFIAFFDTTIAIQECKQYIILYTLEVDDSGVKHYKYQEPHSMSKDEWGAINKIYNNTINPKCVLPIDSCSIKCKDNIIPEVYTNYNTRRTETTERFVKDTTSIANTASETEHTKLETDSTRPYTDASSSTKAYTKYKEYTAVSDNYISSETEVTTSKTYYTWANTYMPFKRYTTKSSGILRTTPNSDTEVSETWTSTPVGRGSTTLTSILSVTTEPDIDSTSDSEIYSTIPNAYESSEANIVTSSERDSAMSTRKIANIASGISSTTPTHYEASETSIITTPESDPTSRYTNLPPKSFLTFDSEANSTTRNTYVSSETNTVTTSETESATSNIDSGITSTALSHYVPAEITIFTTLILGSTVPTNDVSENAMTGSESYDAVTDFEMYTAMKYVPSEANTITTSERDSITPNTFLTLKTNATTASGIVSMTPSHYIPTETALITTPKAELTTSDTDVSSSTKSTDTESTLKTITSIDDIVVVTIISKNDTHTDPTIVTTLNAASTTPNNDISSDLITSAQSKETTIYSNEPTTTEKHTNIPKTTSVGPKIKLDTDDSIVSEMTDSNTTPKSSDMTTVDLVSSRSISEYKPIEKGLTQQEKKEKNKTTAIIVATVAVCSLGVAAVTYFIARKIEGLLQSNTYSLPNA